MVAYEKQEWRDRADGDETPLNAKRLGHMEDGIKSAIKTLTGNDGTAQPNTASDDVQIIGGTCVLVTASGSKLTIDIRAGSIDDSRLTGVVSIEHGGTGKSTAAEARDAIGAAQVKHSSMDDVHGSGGSGMYGHVKLSDAVDQPTLDVAGGTAATPAAVASANDLAAQAFAKAKSVEAGGVAEGSITTEKIARSAVTESRVAAHAITQAKLSEELQAALGLTVI